jgi:serine/threonine protein kinase
MAVAPGVRLGHYTILAPLGAGGMGEVWLAEDTTLKRKVALKLLPAAVAADPDRLAHFQRAVETIAAPSHPTPAVSLLLDVSFRRLAVSGRP